MNGSSSIINTQKIFGQLPGFDTLSACSLVSPAVVRRCVEGRVLRWRSSRGGKLDDRMLGFMAIVICDRAHGGGCFTGRSSGRADPLCNVPHDRCVLMAFAAYFGVATPWHLEAAVVMAFVALPLALQRSASEGKRQRELHANLT